MKLKLFRSSSDPSHKSIDGAVQTVKGFLVCVQSVNLKGVVYGTELADVGDAKYSKSLKEAYEMGKNV